MIYVYVLIISFLITTICIPFFIKIAPRLGLVDIPDERKRHRRPIPKVGGLALVIGTIVPVLIWTRGNHSLFFILLGALIIALFGLLDDISNLSPKIKFSVQILASFLVILGSGVKIFSLGYIFGGSEVLLGALAIPITVFWLVLGTNAINLADGLDGLAAGLCLLIFCFICFLAFESWHYAVALMAFSVCGGIIGFLKYNTFPAIVFLGDTGSQFLGFLASLLLVVVTQQSIYSPILPLLLLGIPIVDTTYVFLNRILQGRSPFQSDRSHLHYRLMDLGFSHQQSVLLIYIIQTFFVTIAFLCRFGQDKLLFWSYLSFLVFFIVIILGLQRKKGRLLSFSNASKIFLSAPSPQKFIRTRVAYYSFASMIILLGMFFVCAPFLLKKVSKDVGLISGFLFLIILLFFKFQGLSKFLFVTSVFFLSFYYFYFLDFKNQFLLIPNLNNACNLFFLGLGVLYIIYVIGSNREVSITNFDYLVLIIALVIPHLATRVTWQNNLDEFFIKLIAVYFFITTIHREKSFKFLYACVVLSLAFLFGRFFLTAGYKSLFW